MNKTGKKAAVPLIGLLSSIFLESKAYKKYIHITIDEIMHIKNPIFKLLTSPPKYRINMHVFVIGNSKSENFLLKIKDNKEPRVLNHPTTIKKPIKLYLSIYFRHIILLIIPTYDCIILATLVLTFKSA